MEYRTFFILPLDQQSSWNVGKPFLEKYKNVFVFSDLRLESSIPWNIRTFFVGTCLSLGRESFIPQNIRSFFFSGGRNIRNFVRVFFFYFLSLELEIVPVIPIILCLLKSEVFFNNQIWDEKFHIDKTDNLDSFQAHTSKKWVVNI